MARFKSKHARVPGSTPAPVGFRPRPRFVSDIFNWDIYLNMNAPYLHNPVANLGVTQGSHPMLFEVGSYGDASKQLQAQFAAINAMYPEQPLISQTS